MVLIWIAMSPTLLKSSVSQRANRRTKSSRYSTWSTTITRPAPNSQAHRAAMMPTGPAPKTTTVSPSRISPISAAW